MPPNPKSEAWFLCALKKSQPYQDCARIEAESGNDKAPIPSKPNLSKCWDNPLTPQYLSTLCIQERSMQTESTCPVSIDISIEHKKCNAAWDNHFRADVLFQH